MLAIYNSSHTCVASYSYDAWGNIISKSGTLADVNPFRYRSYYYDAETWFYYLQSRYYDPQICRFINADIFTSTGQGLLGNNMFAYCRNNPVSRVDASGWADISAAEESFDDDVEVGPNEQEIGGGGGGTQSPDIGFSSFRALKNFLGSAGKNMHWHHIVEQSQIQKSGFTSEQIHNTSNIIAVDAETHAKITGYYGSTKMRFTGGLSVRNWLSGHPFQVQFDFGVKVLQKFEVIK